MFARIFGIVTLLAWTGAARAQLPATTPVPASSPSTQPAAILRPIPDASTQAKSQQTLHQVFSIDFAKTAVADRQTLAVTLLTQARQIQDDESARYVALTDACDLAAGAGDAATAMRAIDELQRRFAVDDLQLRFAALQKASVVATGAADLSSLVQLALQTADLAAESDAFDKVTPLAGLAEAAANKSRQMNIVTSIQVHLSGLRALAQEYADVKTARTTLQQSPDDAHAHLVIGRFYALHKGQWSLGLMDLAQSADPALAPLAQQELTAPQNGLAQAALADAWWDFAQKSAGTTRAHVLAHATALYQSAQALLQNVTLPLIQNRIQQGLTQTAPGTKLAATQLLPLVDLAHAGTGIWTRSPDGLTCAIGPYACLPLPYTPAEEYDLAVTFTRVEDNGPIAVLLAAQKHAFEFLLDVKGEARFEQVAGKLVKDNPTLAPVAISNGKRYTLTIQVRSDHVTALLDGKQLCTYKTDLKDLTRSSNWKLGDNALCGIGANGAKVTFQSVDMTDIKGTGKPLR